MMTRRIRHLAQVAAFSILVIVLLFVADSRYRVLPDALHNHLPIHYAGSVVTDITIQTCSRANPLSNCRLDPNVWHRVEKNLYLNTAWMKSAWLHVQWKQEEDLTEEDSVVVGVRVSKLDPGAEDGNKDWEKRPGGLWVLRSSKKHAADSSHGVTGIDVLFGADAAEPRPNWEMSEVPLDLDANPPAYLSTHQGQSKRVPTPKPRIKKNGRFKILQVSDMHLATGLGVCRDAIGLNDQPSKNCDADPRTLEFLESVLDDEKPDMVVLSGDQVEGPKAPDTQSTLLKLTAPLIARRIPYAAIFGNHDDEGDYASSREAQMALLETLPYSLSQRGPKKVDGVGNYYIEVLTALPSQHSALTIYLLDTHGLTPDEKNFAGYDWLKQSQVEWFRTTHEERAKTSLHTKYTFTHLDMAFIHIPLPEYADEKNVVKGGSWKESVTAPKFNSGFFDALAEQGVVAVGCGHDHVNDYCALPPAQETEGGRHKKTTHRGPWMCYAGGSGFGGYAGYGGFHRRMRVWEVDTKAGRILTWKRMECCGEDTKARKDELLIVDAGRAVEPA